jgi:hypothetical protein
MKNKKAEQKARRDARKAQFREIKHRRAAPALHREEPILQERKRFLVVCEGENTEPDYVNALRRYLRMTTTDVVTIGGAGETIRVVEKAEALSRDQDYDRVWVVFDKDNFPAHHFDNAISKARARGFGVAWSNQAFEFWLLLHFVDHQGTGMHRAQCVSRFLECLKPHSIHFDWNGSKRILPGLFQLFVSNEPGSAMTRMEQAMERASRILAFHLTSENPPSGCESSTTVHLLVRELVESAS